MENLAIPYSYNLPEFYLLKAVMVNANGEELCNPLVIRTHTRKWKEFESKTVNDDYNGAPVINFDEKTDTNFGVLKDGTVVLNQTGSTNHLTCTMKDVEDEDNDLLVFTQVEKFTIENPDAAALALQPGDVFMGRTDDQVPQICKVEAVENRNGTLIITPDADASISDYYSLIKTDSVPSLSENEPEPMQIESGEFEAEPYLDLVNVDSVLKWSLDAGPKVNFSDNIKLDTNISIHGKSKISIYYDLHLFGQDYIETSVINEANYTIGATLSAQTENETDLIKDGPSNKADKSLYEVTTPYPTPVPGLTFNVKFNIPLKMELKGSIDLKEEGKFESGFKYTSDSGRQAIDKKEKHSDLTPNAEGSIKVGIEAGVAFGLLGKTVEAGVSVFAGAKVEGNLYTALGGDLGDELPYHHMCQLCIDANAKFCFSADAKLSYDLELVEGEIFSTNLFNLEIPFRFGKEDSLYVSLVHANSQVFPDLLPRVGFGDCPNKAYQTQLKALNNQGQLSPDIPVSFLSADGNTSLKTGRGSIKDYLFDGRYVIEAKFPNKTVRRNIVVSKGKTAHTLKETSGEPVMTGSVKDAHDGSPIQGAQILIQKNGSVINSIETDADGKYRETLPESIYLITITKPNYLPYKQYVQTKDGETTTVGEAKMIRAESVKPGGVYGKITNSINNSGVSDAIIEVLEGSDNNGYSLPLMSVRTDSSGNYNLKLASILGTKIGLMPGNYTMRVSRNDFVTSSFNVTVFPDQDLKVDFPLSPKGAEDTYRVVLRWGARPSDLDAHFIGKLPSGSEDHVFYDHKNGNTAKLDVDRTHSYGPETVTVTGFDRLEDGFTYVVHDYSNRSKTDSKALSNSGAVVELYKGSTLLATYNVPVDRSATAWRVFSIDKNHQIHRLDEMTNESRSSAVRRAVHSSSKALSK